MVELIMKYINYHNNTLLTWFRIFGYGLCVRNTRTSNFSLTFSERMGFKKYTKIFGYIITTLKPIK